MLSKMRIERSAMKKLNRKTLVLRGTKKRVGDIKSIFQTMEYSFQFLHTSLISTNNCITFLYSWGHIIIYTFPLEKIITIDFLYPSWNTKIDAMIKDIVSIFEPENYTLKDVT